MTLLGELADLWRKLEMRTIEIDKTDPITIEAKINATRETSATATRIKILARARAR